MVSRLQNEPAPALLRTCVASTARADPVGHALVSPSSMAAAAFIACAACADAGDGLVSSGVMWLVCLVTAAMVVDSRARGGV